MVPGGECGIGPVSVRADIKFPDDEVAERIETPFIDHDEGIDHVAGGLAEFLAILLPPAMRENLTRERQSRGSQHDRPVNGMKLQYVLADDMNGGPEAGAVGA